ncbi:uncharacterized protein EI90DRAFT_3020922 [Cantharellus anzutake]|uniref:uncharacterized protein n=1 Tax=Cantharellus anzutake TaxID=1750568 RepID=UPI0019071B4F|nr:uncharacterized protein EI90DRAFT_3020922 [Cantharellus anzutake]KAF8318864.1 hypothetical protein EI90DRAFT_3020922 [Cantharellus anzutake]
MECSDIETCELCPQSGNTLTQMSTQHLKLRSTAANDVDLPKEDPLMQPPLLLRHHLSGLLGGPMMRQSSSTIFLKLSAQVDKVWNGASAHLLEQCGTVFKPSACKNKYGKLKQIYWAVKQLSEQSGFPWSNENGADLGPEEEQLWIDFVAVRVASGCSIPSKRVATL